LAGLSWAGVSLTPRRRRGVPLGFLFEGFRGGMM